MSLRLLILCSLISVNGYSQISTDSSAFFIKDIYRQSYTELKGYEWLTTLCKDIGHRLAGSEASVKAAEWAKATMDTFGLDSVWLQPVMVPHWERGVNEQVVMISKEIGAHSLMAYALGNSPGTGPKGIRGEVIEVQSIDELKALPDEAVKDKIVFFNRAFDLGLLSTFAAYGGAADQRWMGPRAAAEKGAMGVVIRSLSSRKDDYPHTGSTFVADTVRNIPSAAISTNDADLLTRALHAGKTEIAMYTYGIMHEEALNYNVIGEIKGSTYPDEIILVGGHLDSWDVGEGAHDDGSGCVHSMEVMYRLRKNGYRPLRTIRCVLFANEENGLRGGKAYAETAIQNKEFHLAAIESDGGGATPQAFGISAGEHSKLDSAMSFMNTWFNLLEPYDIELKAGGGGADIGPLKPMAGILMGLRPDNARYFDYHHSDLDVLENVHPRELASGSAALTALVFLIDQYGIGK
jgi:carboxypeptidase Q